jgi:hypothetical protein
MHDDVRARVSTKQTNKQVERTVINRVRQHGAETVNVDASL